MFRYKNKEVEEIGVKETEKTLNIYKWRRKNSLTVGIQYAIKENQSWLKKNMPVFCSTLVEMNFDEIDIKMNRHPKILIDIVDISFPKLKTLFIQHNGLVSVECFSQIYIPQLQNLYMGKNSLRSIKNLRKMGCTNLRNLGIVQNKLLDLSYLSQFPFSKKIEAIFLENILKCSKQSEDLNCLVKLPLVKVSNKICFILEYLGFKSYQRICQSKLKQQLKKKLPEATINDQSVSDPYRNWILESDDDFFEEDYYY